MLFFSELIGKPVYSEDQHLLGVLRDIRFINAETPQITKIVVDKNGRTAELPIITLRQVNSHVTVKKAQSEPKPNKNELSAARRLLDKQIIDLVGNKVVRVNDIVLQDIPTPSLSGIDIGFLGILRRLGLERITRNIAHFFRIELPMNLLSWGDVLTLELKDGQIQLKQHEERLSKIREEDLADYLEMTNTKNVNRFLKTIDAKRAAQVFENLAIHYQVDLFGKFEPKRAADLTTRIDPDEAVDILLALDRSQRDKIMKLLPARKQEELHRLMTFSRTPVGKRMTSEFFTVESHDTVGEIVKAIKRDTADFSWFQTIYVLNRDDQLVGVFNPHELLLQSSDVPAYKFMIPEPIVVLLTTPIEVVIYKLFKYKLSALPVVNRDKKMLGIITIDDISATILKKML